MQRSEQPLLRGGRRSAAVEPVQRLLDAVFGFDLGRQGSLSPSGDFFRDWTLVAHGCVLGPIAGQIGSRQPTSDAGPPRSSECRLWLAGCLCGLRRRNSTRTLCSAGLHAHVGRAERFGPLRAAGNRRRRHAGRRKGPGDDLRPGRLRAVSRVGDAEPLRHAGRSIRRADRQTASGQASGSIEREKQRQSAKEPERVEAIGPRIRGGASQVK